MAGVTRHSAATQGGRQRHQAAAVKSPSTPATPMVGHVPHGLCPGPHRRHGLRRRPLVRNDLQLTQMPTASMFSNACTRGQPPARHSVPSAGQGCGAMRCPQPHGSHRTKLPSVHPPLVAVRKPHFHPISSTLIQDRHGLPCQHLIHAFRAVRSLCPEGDVTERAPAICHVNPGIPQSQLKRHPLRCKCQRLPSFCRAA